MLIGLDNIPMSLLAHILDTHLRYFSATGLKSVNFTP